MAGGVSAWIGALVAAAMQVSTRNLGLAIVPGVAAVWAAQVRWGDGASSPCLTPRDAGPGSEIRPVGYSSVGWR